MWTARDDFFYMFDFIVLTDKIGLFVDEFIHFFDACWEKLGDKILYLRMVGSFKLLLSGDLE